MKFKHGQKVKILNENITKFYGVKEGIIEDFNIRNQDSIEYRVVIELTDGQQVSLYIYEGDLK